MQTTLAKLFPPWVHWLLLCQFMLSLSGQHNFSSLQFLPVFFQDACAAVCVGGGMLLGASSPCAHGHAGIMDCFWVSLSKGSRSHPLSGGWCFG